MSKMNIVVSGGKYLSSTSTKYKLEVLFFYLSTLTGLDLVYTWFDSWFNLI